MADTTRTRALQRRLRIEKTLASLSAAICLLTLVWSDWIETVFRVDPDHGNGTIEWMIVAILAAATVLFASLARADRRRRLALTAGGT